MKHSRSTFVWTVILVLISACCDHREPAWSKSEAGEGTISASGFLDPPDRYKTWVYWWWLKGWIDEVLNQSYTSGNGTHDIGLITAGLLGPVQLSTIYEY